MFSFLNDVESNADRNISSEETTDEIIARLLMADEELRATFHEPQAAQSGEDGNLETDAMVAQMLQDEFQAEHLAFVAENERNQQLAIEWAEKFDAQRKRIDEDVLRDSMIAKRIQVSEGHPTCHDTNEDDTVIARLHQEDYDREHKEMEVGARKVRAGDWAALRIKLSEDARKDENARIQCVPRAKLESGKKSLPSPVSVAATEGTLLRQFPSIQQMRKDTEEIDLQIKMLRDKIASKSNSKYRQYAVPDLARRIAKLQAQKLALCKQAVREAFEKDGGYASLEANCQVDLHQLWAKEAIYALHYTKQYCSERKLGRIKIISGIGSKHNCKLLLLVRKTVTKDPRCKIWEVGPGHVVVEYK